MTASFERAHAPHLADDQIAELERAIGELVDLPAVHLGPAPFATSHIVVLERAIANTRQGRIATGLTRETPELFHLLSDGKRCVVERRSSGERRPLSFPCRKVEARMLEEDGAQ